MRHTVVTRASLAISGLLVAASLGFAWIVGRHRSNAHDNAGEPLGGERSFAEHCAECHATQDIVSRLRAAPELERAARDTLVFLIDHGDADDEADRSIVEYLRVLALRNSPANSR